MKRSILLTTVLAAALMGCEQADEAIDKAGSTVTDTAKETVSLVEEKSGEVLDAAKEATNDAVDGVKDAAVNAVESTREAGAGMIDGAKDITSAAVDKTTSMVNDATDTAKSVVADTVDSTKEMGENALSGAKDAVANATEATKEKVAGATAAVAGLAAVPNKASGADLAKGEEVYSTACKLCHDSGMMGAPKLGKADDWGSRMAQGMDTLNTNAIKGIRGMPAKGGKASLSDDEVKAAVAYMLSKSH